MAKKRKKAPSRPQKFSESRYLRERVRTFPIKVCLANPDWQEVGLSEIVVCREQPSGKIAMGIFLVDVHCLGLKNAVHRLNMTDDEVLDIVESIDQAHDSPLEEIPYVMAHNIIYGAIEYADDLGFSPHKDFGLAKYILEEDTDEIEYIELEFGKDGQPFYLSGPYDNVSKILSTLNRTVGEGNYEYLAHIDSGWD